MELVQAFEQVVQHYPDASLHIAGECRTDPQYVAEIREFSRKAKFENHVIFLGELNQEQLLREYEECCFLALPSAQETTPMVIAQAMAAGKPVVATRVGGVAEMIGEHGERGILVSVGDIDQLAKAMILLLQDDTLRMRISQAGIRFAQENYHPAQVAERTAQAYREVVAREVNRIG